MDSLTEAIDCYDAFRWRCVCQTDNTEHRSIQL